MTKRILIPWILSISISLNSQTNEQVESTCYVLQIMTQSAFNNQDNSLVTLYFNTYKSLAENYSLSENCHSFFEEVGEQSDAFGEWLLNKNYPPQPLSTFINRILLDENPALAGSFTHREIELIREVKGGGFTHSDITLLKKINSLKLTDQILNDALNRDILESRLNVAPRIDNSTRLRQSNRRGGS